LHANPDGTWVLKPEIERDCSEEEQTAWANCGKHNNAFLSNRRWRIFAEHASCYATRVERLRELSEFLDWARRDTFVPARSRAMAEARVTADSAVAAARNRVAQALAQLPAPLQPWDDPGWAQWAARPAEQALALSLLYAGTV